MSTFQHIAGYSTSMAHDLTTLPEDERSAEERIADALESIALSLVAANLIATAEWDNDSPAGEAFRQGWLQQ